MTLRPLVSILACCWIAVNALNAGNREPQQDQRSMNPFDSVEVVDLTTAATIVVFGDSYSESDYTLRAKPYVMKVAEQLDYRLINFAKSGDNALDVIKRIDANEVRFNSSIGIKDTHASYGLIVLYANDSAYRFWDLEMYKENLRDLVGRVRELGMKPIISSEFFLHNFSQKNPGSLDSAMLRELADEMGVLFIDTAEVAMNFYKSRVKGTFYGTHPGIRTNSLMHKLMSDELQVLPRPKRSVKIYRNRTVENDFERDTLYKNDVEKIQRYAELEIGHNALTPENEIYFDRLHLANAPVYSVVNDEYLALINHESVAFDRHALIEFIIPYYAKDVDAFRMKLPVARDDGAPVEIYIRKKRAPFVADKRTAFLPEGAPNVHVSDSYMISGTNESRLDGEIVTVTGMRDGYIVTDMPHKYASLFESGQLIRQSGSGAESIHFVEMQAAFEPEYYDAFTQRYEWERLAAVTNDDGYLYIDNSGRSYVEGDEVVLLLRRTTGFRMTGQPVLELPKTDATKPVRQGKSLRPYASGPRMIKQRTIVAGLDGWVLSGTPEFSAPKSVGNARWSKGVVVLSDEDHISQTLHNVGLEKPWLNQRTSAQCQFIIWAVYDPPLFEGTDLSQSEITSRSYDSSTLVLELYSDERFPIRIEREVSLGWNEIIINTMIPPDVVNPVMKLKGTQKGVSVGYVDVLMR